MFDYIVYKTKVCYYKNTIKRNYNIKRKKTMTEIYIMNTRRLNEPEVFSREIENISCFRRERTMSLKRESDRILSLGAGILIRRGLYKLGLNEKETRYSLNKYGKPYFKDYPKIQFNVSHCRDMAICAFSEFNIGCDIELVRDTGLSAAEKFFSASEKEYIYGFKSKNERTRAFFRIWTLKESFAKAVGKGLSMPFREFSINPSEYEPYIICSRIEKNYYFKEYDLGSYLTACCCEHNAFPESPELVSID